MFERLKKFVRRHEARFDEYLLLAGLSRADAFTLFYTSDSAARQKMAIAHSIGEKNTCQRFARMQEFSTR
jgi:hypothetical protein